MTMKKARMATTTEMMTTTTDRSRSGTHAMKISINFAAPCIAVLHLLGAAALPARADDAFLVKDGQPHAEIIIAEQAPRTTRLAAQELQLYVEKISGARLPIATEPSGRRAGESLRRPEPSHRAAQRDGRRVERRRLPHRLRRRLAGARRRRRRLHARRAVAAQQRRLDERPRPRAVGQADRLDIGATRISQLYKNYTGQTATFGKPGHEPAAKDGTVHVWGFDERGSFNAVCGFLRSLGVRWYLPGELGEVVPKTASIALPEDRRDGAARLSGAGASTSASACTAAKRRCGPCGWASAIRTACRSPTACTP